MIAKEKPKFLAYYLPQFHPIPENDLWWGKGFTEWTNVTKAKPIFNGHYQPILPADLGFYDLRIPEVQIEQSELAQKYGIDGFIYYQYWFGNDKMLLEKPAEAMLKNPKVTIPFCFCWANETWKGIWHGVDNPDTLIEQSYNGIEGYEKYFDYLLPFFKDGRYIKIGNKPIFQIYRLNDIPNVDVFFEIFNTLAKQNGFDGIYFVSTVVADINHYEDNPNVSAQVGIDTFFKLRNAQYSPSKIKYLSDRILHKIKKKLNINTNFESLKKPRIFDYSKAVDKLSVDFPNKKYIPCVFPNWDNSARAKNKSMIFNNATPEKWQLNLEKNIQELKKNPDNPKFIIIKSWNEWAEGNYLEPDQKYGHQWLQSVLNVKNSL